MDEKEYDKLIERLNWIRTGIEKSVLVRLSHPSDFRSLVDIFPTKEVVNPILKDINYTIEKIFGEILNNEADIKKYARGTGVFYDVKDLRIGVVPKMDVPILTVTEHPNFDEIFVDKSFINEDGIKEIKSEGDSAPLIEKIKKLLDLLKNEGVLDENVAYQLELGELLDGKHILFQVKEFAKRFPLKEVKHDYSAAINRIISGSNQDGIYEIPIIYEEDLSIGVATCKDHEKDLCLKDLCLVVGESQSLIPLKASDYDPNISGYIHGDNRLGVFNHKSFRIAQAVVQKGGIATLGPSINRVLKRFQINPEGKNTLCVEIKDGVLNFSIK